MAARTPAFRSYQAFQRRQQAFFDAATRAMNQQVGRLNRRVRSGRTKAVRKTTLERLLDVVMVNGEWLVVMMVTGAEAYLVDVLAYAAESDPRHMEQSGQQVSYHDVIEATSTADLAVEMRRRWARNFVDDGGPRRWIDRLTRMGARGYPDDLADILEELWGVRHMVVHNAGKASWDFMRRHPEAGAELNKEIPLDRDRRLRYAEAVNAFIDATDQLFSRRAKRGS